jgi:hypothetical protein
MKVLEDCKCMFEVEHKFIRNNNLVGDIGYCIVDTVIRYNFGLCVLKEHIENKLEREKVENDKDIVNKNEEHKTVICCGKFSDAWNSGLIEFPFDPFNVNPFFNIKGERDELIQEGCTHCMFCGSKK